MILRSPILFLISFLFFIFPVFADVPTRYIYLDDPTAVYLEYLVNSGHYVSRFILQQPYELGNIDSSTWRSVAGRYFQHYWQRYYLGDVSAQLQLQDRLRYQKKVLLNRYLLAGGIHLVFPHITFANRTMVDQDYKYDPKYAGDLSESDHWLYGRVNDAYMNLHYGSFELFLGRMHRNWGLPGANGLLLSVHPYTYDHILFTYQNRYLRFSLIFSRLEDMEGWTIPYEDKPDSLVYYSEVRKFLVGHRFDIRFSNYFQIALTEMAVYGGPGRDIELAFLNPMTFYYGVQRNDQKLMSGLWALDIFYKPSPKFTLFSQFLIDDIIVNNDPGVNDRARYPDRLGILFNWRSGDWLIKELSTSITYVRIWNRTYQSRNNWENYHYRGLGIGYPCASCEEVKLKISYWGGFPFYFEDEVIWGRYGDVELTDLFPLHKEPFPVPPVTNNLINRFKLYYYFNPLMQAFLKINHFKNAQHYLNRLKGQGVYQFELGIRILLSVQFK